MITIHTTTVTSGALWASPLRRFTAFPAAASQRRCVTHTLGVQLR